MDEVASNLLATLKKPHASVESKLTLFNSLKSNIKHQRIPESAQGTSLDCVRLAIGSQTSSSLVSTGFSTLGHLIKRLTLQDQVNVIFSSRSQVVPTLLERLGDSRENYRVAASQSLTDLWLSRPDIIEKAVRDGAILSSNARAKEAGMEWVVKMHDQHSLQFRGFVPCIVGCLEHADGNVRDSAKANVVELFRNSPDRAKTDLKRQLVALNIRKSIASSILSQLHISLPQELTSNTPSQSQAQSETPHQDGGIMDRSQMTEPSLPPSAEAAHVEALYIDSQRDLEDTFRSMHPCFEGREDESNWKPRDNNVLKLRRLLQGNAPTAFQIAFVAGTKNLLDGILKVVNSLRTTMSSNGCQFVQELARTMGPAIDPMVEIFLQNFVKMCAATKSISSQNGNATVDAILSSVSYNIRLMQHIWQASQDKNVQPRSYVSGWLKTMINRHAQNRALFEHSGGLDLTEKSIKKGLNDANPKVREGMRGTFWLFAQLWPTKGEGIINGLDTKSRQLLEKDSANPDATVDAFTNSVGPSTMSNPRAAPTNARSTLKETIAAQKKASMAAKHLPDRPNSAMATLSPAKHSIVSSHRPTPSAPAGSVRGLPANGSHSSRQPLGTSSNTSHGSLMSGPVRRPRKPEVSRPATADPYTNRRTLRGETPPLRSPGNSPVRPVSKGSGSSNTSSYARSTTTSNLRAAAGDSVVSSRATSPRTSPMKGKPKTVPAEANSRIPTLSQADEQAPNASEDKNFTMVVPSEKSLLRSPSSFQKQRPDDDRPGTSQSSLPMMTEEDNFTMVMPVRGGNINIPVLRGQSRPDEGEGGIHHALQSSAVATTTPWPEDSDMFVYEDPNSAQAQSAPEEPERAVLEEVSLNEHSQPPWPQRDGQQNHDAYREAQSADSPSKKGAPGKETPAQDRAEALKIGRLIASGIDRLNARALDPHGFRRLQDLVKSTSKDSGTHLAGLLVALSDYLEAPDESLKVNATRAQNLKSQALATMRALLSLHRRELDVRHELSQCLGAVLMAKKATDMISHMALDLDKTADEVVHHAQDQVSNCVSKVLSLMDSDDPSNAAGHRRLVTMALSVLSKLVAVAHNGEEGLAAPQLEHVARLAVKSLDDTDSDVRRADIGLCMELFAVYGEERKEEFWASLKGARESQLNLVAYYLARRG